MDPGSGKVLGRTRAYVAPKDGPPPLEQTIIIGGDRPPPPPPGAEPEIELDPEDLEIEEEVTPPEPVGPPIDEQIIEEARRKAAQIVSEAQMEAKQLVERTAAQTQQAAEQAFAQAQEKGYAEGLETGQKAGYEQSVGEFLQRINQAKDMFVQLVKARRQVLSDIEPQVARLAVKIAEKIVGEELKTNPEIVMGIVRKAMEMMNDREEVSVRVNPEDVAFVREHQASLEKMIEGLKKFEVVPDAALDPGSVVVETNLGNIDARLSTQLAAIKAGIEETAKLRAEEIEQELANAPVEVPGDPDFAAQQAAAAPPPAQEAPPEQPTEAAPEQPAPMDQTQMEMESPETMSVEAPMDQTMMEAPPDA